MGPPTCNDPLYSDDTSSDEDEVPIKETVKDENPDDSPDLDKLGLP